MYATKQLDSLVWKGPTSWWAMLAAGALLSVVVFYDGLSAMVHQWATQEEYGHGFLIPLIALFLVWQKSDRLRHVEFSGAWAGTLITLAGILALILGELSAIYVITQYAFIIVVVGFAVSIMGWSGVKEIWAPLLFLVFMIPLPGFLYNNLSSQLQLISSEIGVAVIRLFGISVYLEGNVIDLGTYKLQVVEACSGLRYLFPLVTLSFISAYFFKVELWKRIVIVLSSIPITVILNSVRIGIIGVLVEYWGPSMAEGFLHDFEGWAMFMACMAVLILEMWWLSRIGRSGRPLREVFGLEFPEPQDPDSKQRHRGITGPFIASFVLLLCALAATKSLQSREEASIARNTFADFPMQFSEWEGRRETLETIYIDTLQFDDYILADYVADDKTRVNFYAAFYASQRKGESMHSPKSCIPGGGWRITTHEARVIPVSDAGALNVNRLVIQKGEYKQLVYYWFQGRGRTVTDEYAAKWYIFWDALTRNRTDGALVRLTTVLLPGQELAEADRRLTSFAEQVSGTLAEYVPE